MPSFFSNVLLYLNHSKLNMNSNVETDIDYMGHKHKRYVTEKPACLLGWVYKEQRRTYRAIQSFQIVICRMFDYFEYHYFHAYYKFLYKNRTFWKKICLQ